MDTVDEATRRRSSALFGNEKLVELVILMDEGRLPTTAQALASGAGIAHNLARAVLLRLASAHILIRLPRLGSRSAAYFDIADESTWRELVTLSRSLVRPIPTSTESSSAATDGARLKPSRPA